jgi:3-dehydroquinate dehydratase type I
MICVSVEANDYDECELLLSKHSFMEFRLDRTNMSLDEIRQLFSLPNRMIATCRKKKFDDSKRLKLLKSAIEGGALYVDIEYDAESEYIRELKSEAKKSFCKLIFSYHNYEITPDETVITEIIEQSISKGADIVKIACKSNSEKDNAFLLSLYNKFEKGKIIVIGMGEQGKITRIADTYLGAPFTYASLEKNFETAPGQIDIDSMKRINDLMK